jgi:hypothetical protein
VALSVAAVVVANPVIVPRADLQVPAVQLSGTGDAMDMLNKDFLSAIGPAQAEPSSNPISVLKDLISSLAADASYLGRNAIIAAFFAGATAVTNPELTAASYPYVPAPPYLPAPAVTGGPVASPAPMLSLPAAGPVSTEQLLALSAVPAELIPAAAEMVMTLMDDVHGITDDAVTAAFAAGALLVTQGGRAIDTLRGLINRDLRAVLSAAVTVVTAGDPQKAIINAIDSVIEQPGYETTSVQTAPSQSPAIGQRTSPDSDPVASPVVNSTANPVAAERVQRRKTTAESPVILPTPAPAAAVVDAEVSLPGFARGADQTAAPVRNPVRSGPVNDIVKDARTQTDHALRNAADAVRHAAGRAARAVAGPAGD